jgi:hypothetical protein
VLAAVGVNVERALYPTWVSASIARPSFFDQFASSDERAKNPDAVAVVHVYAAGVSTRYLVSITPVGGDAEWPCVSPR